MKLGVRRFRLKFLRIMYSVTRNASTSKTPCIVIPAFDYCLIDGIFYVKNVHEYSFIRCDQE
jgi:hypothetical protein